MKSIVRDIWRLFPAPLRTGFWRATNSAREMAIDLVCGIMRRRTDAISPHEPLVVAGLFRSGSGLGEAARGTVRALSSSGLRPIAVDITSRFTHDDMEPGISLSPMPRSRRGVVILHVNAPETIAALAALKLLLKPGWRVIAYWAWELPALPASWRRGFRHVSEIWTLSDYTAQVFRTESSGRKVSAFSLPVAPPSGLEVPATPSRSKEFTVLTFADAHSSFDRKNPMAAIRAFRLAFGDDLSCRLIVKTRNLADRRVAADRLADVIGDAPNISNLDETLSDTARWLLMAGADAIISLHRAEGFGLTLAEGMSLGKPTIATGWSGNLSFMDDDCAILTPYSLTPVMDAYGSYNETQAHWAEPSIEAAAAALRKLRGDPDFAAELGARARARIIEVCDIAKIGAAMTTALRERA